MRCVLIGDDYFADAAKCDGWLKNIKDFFRSIAEARNCPDLFSDVDFILIKNLKMTESWFEVLNKVGENCIIMTKTYFEGEVKNFKQEGLLMLVLDQLDANEGQKEVEELKRLASSAHMEVLIKYYE